MFFLAFVKHYLFWHYSLALVGYVRVSRNFWWFLFHYFSISILSATLFAPYKRQVEYPNSRFSLENLLERFVLNFFSRVVGFIVRLCIIVIGFIILCIYTTLSLAGFAFWLSAPLLIFVSVFFGIWLLFI